MNHSPVLVNQNNSNTTTTNNDTLTLVGSGMSVTADSGTKTVTFTSSAYSGLFSYTAGNVSSNNYNLDFSTSSAIVSLNNGNVVQILQQQGNWAYVQVISGPNSQVNGMQGWVNSYYLALF